MAKFRFENTKDSKEISKSVIFIMQQSQDFTVVDFTKTQKPKYLKNETFFLQIKKFINYASRATLWQKNTFVAEVTYNGLKSCK